MRASTSRASFAMSGVYRAMKRLRSLAGLVERMQPACHRVLTGAILACTTRAFEKPSCRPKCLRRDGTAEWFAIGDTHALNHVLRFTNDRTSQHCDIRAFDWTRRAPSL